MSRIRWARIVPAAGAVALLAAAAVGVTPAQAAELADTSQTFTYTGAEQSFTVPAGVYQLNVTAIGAGGSSGHDSGGAGGVGAQVSGTMTVTPNSVWTIDVGGRGSVRTGGWGGYSGGDGGQFNGGGGGGATTLNDGQDIPVVVAGGGGGGASGSSGSCPGGHGGNGGDSATDAGSATNGGGGHCSGSGSGGTAAALTTSSGHGNMRAGSKGGNGSSKSDAGGGGGGGGYGGGDGGGGGFFSGGGGGGGGSYGLDMASPTIAPAGSNADGSVALSWSPGESGAAAVKTGLEPAHSASNATPSSRTGHDGLSMALASDNENADGSATGVNVAIGATAVLAASLFMALFVRRRRSRASGD